MPHSNYGRAYTVHNYGLPEEQVCRTCRGTGEDPEVKGADCMDCWGEGTNIIVNKVGYC